MAYDLVEYTKGAGTFVDSDDESIALEELLQAYLEDSERAYILYENNESYDDAPTHIVLYDVVYKLVEVVPQPAAPANGQAD